MVCKSACELEPLASKFASTNVLLTAALCAHVSLLPFATLLLSQQMTGDLMRSNAEKHGCGACRPRMAAFSPLLL